MATKNYQGMKFEKDGVSKIVDSLSVEEALQININEKPFTVTMRTPGHDLSLVRGMFHSEGIIEDTDFHPKVILDRENSEGIVTVLNLDIPSEKLGKGYANSRSLLSVSSCGICGKTELGDLSFLGKALPEIDEVDPGLIESLFSKMNKGQHHFKQSGGTHAAAIFDQKGKMLCLMEDIGRHNAVDKAIGELILKNNLHKSRYLIVSGRVSYEIVIKCFKAGIPCLAAVSAPSTLAVDYAKELGITLFGFCRENRATCYSNIIRINQHHKNSKIA